MAKIFIDEKSLTNIADAIRLKNKENEKYSPVTMVSKIQALKTDNPFEGFNDFSYFFYHGIRKDFLKTFKTVCKENSPINMSSAFAYCSDFGDLSPVIDGIDFSKVTDFVYCFANDDFSSNHIKINSSGATDITGIFSNCSLIDCPELDYTSVQKAYGAFEYCRFQSFDGELPNATDIGAMFRSSSIKNVRIYVPKANKINQLADYSDVEVLDFRNSSGNVNDLGWGSFFSESLKKLLNFNFSKLDQDQGNEYLFQALPNGLTDLTLDPNQTEFNASFSIDLTQCIYFNETSFDNLAKSLPTLTSGGSAIYISRDLYDAIPENTRRYVGEKNWMLAAI